MPTPDLLTTPRRASLHQAWPRVARCECGTDILLARHVGAGTPFRLELVEVLPPTRCSACLGRGIVIGELRHITTGRGSTAEGKSPRYAQGPVQCTQCAGTGRRGEELAGEHVLVSAHDGVARPFTGARSRWEAAHRRHRCALSSDRAAAA